MKRDWCYREHTLELGATTRLMGILNVTPDSFSDGGQFSTVETAIRRALLMQSEGAGIVDVGGESTRPGFEAVSEEEEIDRVVPVIKGVLAKDQNCILSIDTTKATVCRSAFEAGACILNDIWGGLKDPEILRVASEFRAGVVLMRNGRDGNTDGPILARIQESWSRSIDASLSVGISESQIVLDPGVGFGTTREEDLEILQGLTTLRAFGFPILLGVSRKRITSYAEALSIERRLEPSIATTVAGIAAGVELFRVHDVAAHARAAKMADLIYKTENSHE